LRAVVFPGSARAEQYEDAAFLDPERDPVERRRAAG
jgi:hypothetical protein